MSSDFEGDKEKLNELLQKDGELGESDRELLLDIRNRLNRQEAKLDRHEAKRRNKHIQDNIWWILILGAFGGLIAVIVWAFKVCDGY